MPDGAKVLDVIMLLGLSKGCFLEVKGVYKAPQRGIKKQAKVELIITCIYLPTYQRHLIVDESRC